MGKLNLRMPDAIQAKLTKEAVKANRSLNSEIVHRLTVSLKTPTAPSTGLSREDVISIIKEFARGDDA
jgi:hypothetical protein